MFNTYVDKCKKYFVLFCFMMTRHFTFLQTIVFSCKVFKKLDSENFIFLSFAV
jgi:hypothetical protein